MRYVVIMAGGSGKRLWPLSRQDMPKQLLKVLGGKSLLRIAFERLVGTVPAENVLVCTGADYADIVAAELPEVLAENILGEPEGRDSLNAVAWPAAVLAAPRPRRLHRGGDRRPDHASRLGLPGGAGRPDSRSWRPTPAPWSPSGSCPPPRTRDTATSSAGPRWPDAPTSAPWRRSRRSRTAETAAGYVGSGRYWWNSGMFVWRARTLLDQLADLLPETYAAVQRAGRRARAAGRDLSGPGQDQRGLRRDGAGLPGSGHRSRGGGPAAHHLARRRRLRGSRRTAAPRRARQRHARVRVSWSTPGTTW